MLVMSTGWLLVRGVTTRPRGPDSESTPLLSEQTTTHQSRFNDFVDAQSVDLRLDEHDDSLEEEDEAEGTKSISRGILGKLYYYLT